ncbi:ATP synthase F1 subunit epsilon [Candidatus Falkowbacteria bacterium HGW-Falkowbacteria-1]|jgi:F-type H+-transporting ATPase subunit epsilon|uniref:ATP synthase epsilon chain n=1 Tax=Candidatus Falkowbacteria bacterium HGW-Falkowbacteria-1 TaxID=2013768 RepID=A0A2N2E8F3_9BACT|nr:MAG: ATP synthase F1 subunit epsilon [Candidatus Falkowbacteria bacterium HGW-Falkowbacteria-1]
MPDQKRIKFEIATPERVVLKEEIFQVTVPTVEGEITVLPKHSPLVSILKPGVLEVKKIDGEIEIISVSGGFVEVLLNKVIILADTAERAEEIDLERAEEAKRRAEESLKNIRSVDAAQFANIAAQIEKELARSRSVKRWRHLKGR